MPAYQPVEGGGDTCKFSELFLKGGLCSLFSGSWDVSMTADIRAAILDHRQLEQMFGRQGSLDKPLTSYVAETKIDLQLWNFYLCLVFFPLLTSDSNS